MVTRMHKLQLVLLAWDRGYRDLGKGARKWAFERGLRRVRLTKKHFRQKEKHRQRSGSCPWGWPFVRWGSGPPMPSPPWSSRLYGSVKADKVTNVRAKFNVAVAIHLL